VIFPSPIIILKRTIFFRFTINQNDNFVKQKCLIRHQALEISLPAVRQGFRN
jgi:hypothetical protein